MNTNEKRNIAAPGSSRATILPACLLFSMFSGIAFAGDIKIAWDSAGAGLTYKVYYGPSTKNYTKSVPVATSANAGTAVPYTLSGLVEGAYFIAVKSVDSTGAESGFSNEISGQIAAAIPVTVDFTPSASSGVAPLTATFTPKVTGTVTDWFWTFGTTANRSAPAPVASVTKTFNTPGTYVVALTVNGLKVQKTITVDAPPVAAFTTSQISGVVPATVSFTNTSSGALGYSWNFGDGTTSTEVNPTHVYAAAGNYTVTLTATGSDNKTTSTKTLGVSIVASAPSPNPVGPDGLVAAYRFDEIGGLLLVDSSGNQNHALVEAASGIPTPKRVSHSGFMYALGFDSANPVWGTVEDKASLDLSTGMTIEAWVYPTSTTDQWETIVAKEQTAGAVYQLSADSDTGVPVIVDWIGSSEQEARGVDPLVRNQWVYLAATYDGKVQRIYRNGVLEAEHAAAGSIAASASPLRIGANKELSQYFDGALDELRIYNRALSAAEIADAIKPENSIAKTNPGILLLNSNSIGGTAVTLEAGTVEASQMIAGKVGAAFAMWVYVDAQSTATTMTVGLYSDNQGHPATRMTTANSGTLTPGRWNLIRIPAVRLVAGRKYWVAALSTEGNLVLRNEGSAGSAPRESIPATNGTSLPTTWGTDYTSSSGGLLSAYGVGN